MGRSPSMQLTEELRLRTWHRHEIFERLPFVTALVKGELPLESYVAQLRGLAVIFSTLGQRLGAYDSSTNAWGVSALKYRFELLCADLKHFSPQLVPDILPAVRHSLDIARTIRSLPIGHSGRWLGYLYVLEGTTKGNQVHLPDIIRCFGLTGTEGGLFYRGYGDATGAHWDEFRVLMGSGDEHVIGDAILGATEMYDALERLHDSLYPLAEGNRGFTATALNPEAGDHPVPQDPLVLQAALRAGRRCRGEFSYYERRYGERGHRFTDSDAAWLATLTHLPASVVADQVVWLGRVLSARGMPFLLMERQLELLIEELAALGSRIPTEELQAALDDLRLQRTGLMSQQVFDETCAMVAKLISAVSRVGGFPDLPTLLVAAHIDSRMGLPECLASLISWLRSSTDFSESDLENMGEMLKSIP